ncbi:hypothetical protein K492DRAFT_192453 [Lichtheimia hyalospora FSU 10163]|nr:hypothetical protein K492DRAFT_192453 [Lichtheimia hyalospora FSU 10163]
MQIASEYHNDSDSSNDEMEDPDDDVSDKEDSSANLSDKDDHNDKASDNDDYPFDTISYKFETVVDTKDFPENVADLKYRCANAMLAFKNMHGTNEVFKEQEKRLRDILSFVCYINTLTLERQVGPLQ